MTTKVLAIVGSDRSGSTLLDNILGGIPGAFSGGEIRYLWERGLDELRLCGCGVRVVDCEVWSQVLAQVPSETIDTPRMLADLELLRTRHAFTPRVPVVGRRHDRRLIDIARRVAPIYHELAAVSGAKVLVDSSKRPTWGHLLSLTPDVELSVVHLIRDPRAVAHSRKRFKRQIDSTEERGMPQHPPFVSATFWTVWNIAGEPFSHLPGYLRLRYEDLLADPVGAIDAIRSIVGLEMPHPTLTRAEVELSPSHTVSGNPGRFQTGPVALRSDDAWRRDQHPRDRLVVDALTWPLARRYGYHGLRESTRPVSGHV
ncbi:MAG: sulfotransferase [Acidimicrobiia bacterium]